MSKKTFASILIFCLAANCCWQSVIGSQVDPNNPFPNPQQTPQEEQPKTSDPIVIDVNQPQQPPSDLPVPGQSQREPDQKVAVREQFAGWKQAGQGPNGESTVDTLRANWVLLGSNGLLTGRVLGGAKVDAAKVPVYLLSGGGVVDVARTDGDGNFTFNNVLQGTYSLVGFGDDAFFAFSFNAIEFKESIQFKMPQQIVIQAVENKTTINLDWIRFFAPNIKFRVYGRFTSLEGTDDPPWLYGLEGISLLAPQSKPATPIQAHYVSLTESGSLMGRVHQIDEQNGRPVEVRSVRVILIHEDNVVGAVSADNHGVFEIPEVSPGDYSVVAVGADGMACVGIRVGESPDGQESLPVDISMVSPETAGWLNHVASEIAYQRIVGRKQPSSGDGRCNNCGGPMVDGMCGNGCGCGGSSGQGCSKCCKSFWRGVNAIFDQMFYGETFQYNNAGGYGSGGYGSGGYGSGGYGYGDGSGGYGTGPGGQPGCNQCNPGAGAADGYPHQYVDPYGSAPAPTPAGEPIPSTPHQH